MDTQKRWIEPLLADSSDSAMHFANDSFDVLKHLCYILNFGRMLKDVHFIMGRISGGRDTAEGIQSINHQKRQLQQ